MWPRFQPPVIGTVRAKIPDAGPSQMTFKQSSLVIGHVLRSTATRIRTLVANCELLIYKITK